MTEPERSEPRRNKKAADPTVWLDFVPLAWLALLVFAYGALVLAPFAPLPVQVPDVERADRAVLPLLAATGVTGIIRYFRLRAACPSGAAAEGEHRLEEGDHP